MAHNKIYGICESKCFVETISKTQYEADLHLSKIIFCTTENDVAEKNIEIENFKLEIGTCIRVLFKNGNNIGLPTLSVNGNENIEIRYKNKQLRSEFGNFTNGVYKWDSDLILELMYDGEFWQVLGNPIVIDYVPSTVMESHYKIRIDGYKEILKRTSESSFGGMEPETSKTFTFTFPFEVNSNRGFCGCSSEEVQVQDVKVSDDKIECTVYNSKDTKSNPVTVRFFYLGY